MNKELTWTELHEIMTMLEAENNPISREAVTVLADTGICTEAYKVTEYVAAQRCIDRVLARRTKQATETANYDSQTGLPQNMSYLEKGLPPYLEKSLCAMKRSWEIIDNGGTDIHWDVFWCELNADINSAENEQSISKKQAEYLRRQYLRMENAI